LVKRFSDYSPVLSCPGLKLPFPSPCEHCSTLLPIGIMKAFCKQGHATLVDQMVYAKWLCRPWGTSLL